MRLLFTATAVSLCALAGQAGAETYAAAAVRVEDAAAIVTVIPENRADVDVAVTPSARVPAPSVRVTGGRVVIDGGLRNRFRGCSSWMGGAPQVRISGIGSVSRDELPRITIRTPRALDLTFGGAVYTSIGASSGGAVTANGCGDTNIAAASGALDLNLNGSGDVQASPVGGVLTAVLNGSGSLRVARAGADAALRLNGSGDLQVGDVSGRVDARLAGSGSLNVGAARGAARLVLDGSGDVEAGAIAGSLDAALHGSGSVSVASVNGESADLELGSSGDIAIRGGHVARLNAHNSGSGSVDFHGAAEATRVALSGSGDIDVADAGHVEQLVDQGSGTVHLGR